MKNTLYRIKPKIELEHPELSGPAMIMCDGGTLFAELHPVKIKANVKGPCEFCTTYTNNLITWPARTEAGEEIKTVWARYCFNCGRRLPNEEARP